MTGSRSVFSSCQSVVLCVLKSNTIGIHLLFLSSCSSSERSSRYMVEIQGTFFSVQSDFVGFVALLRDWGVLAVKAKGGVFRERPLRKGPSRSTHLKLLGYRVTGAAGRRHVRAVKNPNSGETSTVKRTAKVVDEPASSEVQQTGEGVGSITRLGVVHPEEKSK